MEKTPPVVGVGSSAGAWLPEDSGIAWVLIQHMAPDRPSELARILARRTDVPVEEVKRDTQVVADRIYLIAPGR